MKLQKELLEEFLEKIIRKKITLTGEISGKSPAIFLSNSCRNVLLEESKLLKDFFFKKIVGIFLNISGKIAGGILRENL